MDNSKLTTDSNETSSKHLIKNDDKKIQSFRLNSNLKRSNSFLSHMTEKNQVFSSLMSSSSSSSSGVSSSSSSPTSKPLTHSLSVKNIAKKYEKGLLSEPRVAGSVVKIINHNRTGEGLVSSRLKSFSVSSHDQLLKRSATNVTNTPPQKIQILPNQSHKSLLEMLFAHNNREKNSSSAKGTFQNQINHADIQPTSLRLSHDTHLNNLVSKCITDRTGKLDESDQKKTKTMNSLHKMLNRFVEHKGKKDEHKFEPINGYDDLYSSIKKNERKSSLSYKSIENKLSRKASASYSSLYNSLPSRNFRSLLDLFRGSKSDKNLSLENLNNSAEKQTENLEIQLDKEGGKEELEKECFDFEDLGNEGLEEEKKTEGLGKKELNKEVIIKEDLDKENIQKEDLDNEEVINKEDFVREEFIKEEKCLKEKIIEDKQEERETEISVPILNTSKAKKSVLKDPSSGKSSLKVRWKDSIEISNILIEKVNDSEDDDECINDIYNEYDDDDDDELNSESDESIESSELEFNNSASKIIIDKKFSREIETAYNNIEEFNLKPLHKLGAEFEAEMVDRVLKLEKIAQASLEQQEDNGFSRIYADLESVSVELHATIEHVRLSSMMPNDQAVCEKEISNEIFRKSLEENLNEIAVRCREFVHSSKTMISTALVDDEQMLPNVRSAMNSLSLLVKVCFQICFEYMFKNEKLDQIRQLLIQILNLLNTFRNTLNITFLAVNKQLNDVQMDLLIKQAHSLADEISQLIQRFKQIY